MFQLLVNREAPQRTAKNGNFAQRKHERMHY